METGLLTKSEAARILEISRPTFNKLFNKKVFVVKCPNEREYITAESLYDYLQKDDSKPKAFKKYPTLKPQSERPLI